MSRRTPLFVFLSLLLVPACGSLGTSDEDAVITDLVGSWDSGCVDLATTSRRVLITFGEDGTFTEEATAFGGLGCPDGVERFSYRIAATWAYDDLTGEFPVVGRNLSEAAVTPLSAGTTAVLEFESCGGFSWVQSQEQLVGSEGLSCLEQTNGSGDYELSIPALAVEQVASYSMADADTLELAWAAPGSGVAPASLEGSLTFTRVDDSTGGDSDGATDGETSGDSDGGSSCTTPDFDAFLTAHAGDYQSICLPKTAGGSNRYAFTLIDSGACGAHALTWEVAGFSTSDCSGAQGGGRSGTAIALSWDASTDRASLQATENIHFSFYDDGGTLKVDITHPPVDGSPVLGNVLTPSP